MSFRPHNLIRLAACGALTLVITACTPSPTAPQGLNEQGGSPDVTSVTSATASMTITAIDASQRTVTLRGADGRSHTYRCGKDVVNFDQMKVGDQVNATVVESVAMAVRKSSDPLSASEGSMVALSARGAKPGVVMANTAQITGKVKQVRPWDRSIAFEDMNGGLTEFAVGPAVDLSRIKVGEEVTLTTTESLALLVEAPRAGATAAAGSTVATAVAVDNDITAEEARAIATEAYIYGYPLVTMEMTRRVMTNVASAEGTRAPMGQFVIMREYPNATFTDVTAPNADTLYSSAWLDLAKEPYVLSLPDLDDRYFLMPMLDGWTTVFQVPGKRTTGTKAQTYAITGPFWKGDAGSLPAGVKQLKAPTNLVWILGRTYCTGTPEDYKAAHAIMDKYALMPLSAYGKPFTPAKGTVDPSIDMKTPVRDQVNALDAGTYFNLLATLMQTNPPAAADGPLLARMARLGIAPGQYFQEANFSIEAAAAIKQVPAAAFQKIMANLKTIGKDESGWVFTTSTGVYGADYLARATVTAVGLGANRPQDAVYPTSETDAAGRPYSGANKYVMHFAKGRTPPVDAFWSITMYNAQYFFVANPLNKYTVSPRNDLKYNADGSLDLYIQHENPGADKEANWLPAPQDRFILMMRLYWPKETPPSIIDGSWKPPAVVEAQ